MTADAYQYLDTSKLINVPANYYHISNESRDRQLCWYVILELVDNVPVVEGKTDCSIRSGYMEWALQNEGYNVELCAKCVNDDDGGMHYHEYLRIFCDQHDLLRIAKKTGCNYIYYEPNVHYPDAVIDRKNVDWDWYDSPNIATDTLAEFVDEYANKLGLYCNFVDEFCWWNYPEMVAQERNLSRIRTCDGLLETD